jgi:hypothetical protein
VRGRRSVQTGRSPPAALSSCDSLQQLWGRPRIIIARTFIGKQAIQGRKVFRTCPSGTWLQPVRERLSRGAVVCDDQPHRDSARTLWGIEQGLTSDFWRDETETFLRPRNGGTTNVPHTQDRDRIACAGLVDHC